MQTTPDAPAIAVDDLAFAYAREPILDAVSLSVAQGEVVALLGASGSGKTTLLRILAGLLAPTRGRVSISGHVVADAGVLVPPERRDLGMVFQDYGLWPHMSVARNVAFPLEMRRLPREEIARRVAAALDRVALGPFAERAPGALSGGQQQRVAIARAIVAEPRLVLFDEPLSNLDRELREQLVEEIGDLLRALGLSGVYVTHDHAEAFALADRVVILAGGRVLQIGTPEEVCSEPSCEAVCDFLKLGPLVDARREGGSYRLADGTALPAPCDAPPGEGRLLLPRAALAIGDAPSPAAAIPARVEAARFRGDGHLASLRLGAGDGGPVVSLPVSARLAPGTLVSLAVAPERLRFFPRNERT